MKIAYTSDIHVDMSEANHGLIDALIDRLVSVKPDVFIIAGDISQSLEKIAETLDRFSKAPGRKMLVPGNHDIWIDSKSRLRQGIDSTVKYENLIPAVCSEFGFEFLPAGPITIGDIGFAGTMGWYDYSFRNRDFDETVSRALYSEGMYERCFWNDKRFVWWLRNPGRKIIHLRDRGLCRLDAEVNRSMTATLKTHLDQLVENKVREIVVVTHMVPFKGLVNYKRELPADFFTAYLGSEGLEKTIRACPLITHSIFGHSHTTHDVRLNGVRVMASPVGYLSKDDLSHLETLAEERLSVFDTVKSGVAMT